MSEPVLEHPDDKLIERTLIQWQICVEMANSISQRRDTMNNFFITLNLAIIAAVSFVWDVKSILILAIGTAICILWLLFIRNYKLLNAAKFAVIIDLERKLPNTPFDDEWQKLKNNKKYKDGTALEKILPILFVVFYIVVATIIIYAKLKTGGSTTQ